MVILRVYLYIIAAFMLLSAACPAQAAEGYLSNGKTVFERYCVGCHGPEGNGEGEAAELLFEKPRDFTAGIFEYKSTPPGSLPTDGDLMKTISRGIPGTPMPSFVLLPEKERRSVIEYIKHFSPRWKEEKVPAVLVIPPVPDDINSPESIERGRAQYAARGCMICHGEKGDGKGAAAGSLMDAGGFPERPRNFRRGVYEGGSAPEELYRTLTFGIEGTPMPPFGSFFKDGELYDLISYLLSLKQEYPE